MESLENLSNESFSYSWILNLKPNIDESFRSSLDEGSFIEMDPTITSFRRAIISHDFDFHNSQPFDLVPADQLFSDGLILPLHLVTPSQTVSSTSLETHPTKTRHMSSESSSKTEVFSKTPKKSTQSRFFDKCERSSRRILGKYLGFLRPVYRKMRRTRSSPGAMNGSDQLVQTSPRTSTTFSSDTESPIYEAVLHCKKSIG
ncbi:putative membrane-associated kinase regulator 6 [Tasmannia lanceolata]|uniref:putative membrane-associated kinase regulator 6 n=1 Tax=Tasmannia lanceolata TaxID=3420 RepID=UPI0040634A4C